jgi:ABC-type branched-subunit amino acid transport system substrate-binding protein
MKSIATMAWALALIAGCGGDDGNTGPVKIGLLTPKTGELQSVGESFERVGNVAVDSINAKGGIDGRPIELLVVDTKTDADTVADKLQDLIDQGAIAVVGPATSGEVNNAYPVARDMKTPIISPSSTAPFLSRTSVIDDGYMFRNVPDDEIQSLAAAYYLTTKRPSGTIKSVALLFEDTEYGKGLKNAFKTAFEGLGGTIPAGYEISYKQGLSTQGATAAHDVIQQLADLPTPPTMVFTVALEGDILALQKAWDNNGGTPMVSGMQFFMTDGARSQKILMEAPASIRGMCGTAPTYPDSGLAYPAFESAYNAKYDDDIASLIYTPNVWDAFHVIAAAAVQQSRKYPSEDLGGQHLRDALTDVSKDGQTFHAGQWRDLISAIRAGNDVDYDGASGPANFDVVGQTIGPYEIWCLSPTGTKFDRDLYLEAKDIQALAQP